MDVKADHYVAFQSVDQLIQIIQDHSFDESKMLVLGGGSNILFCKDIDGLVLKNEIEGIEKVLETDDHVYIKSGAGVNWHQFVLYCVHHHYAGVENLALIPGSVGASPIQNIGAYGVEIKDVFYELEAIQIADGKMITMKNADCAFGYRDSIFKKAYKNKLIITSVTFRLSKHPVFKTSYGAITDELKKMGVETLSLISIAQAVMNIRNSKLPDPKLLGNAGSFFKNPTIATNQFHQLQHKYPSIPGYVVDGGFTKIAAGWLIEQCGWKGYRKGDAACYDKQALVLVNYGNATGLDIVELSSQIIESVNSKFGIVLEREVNVL